MTTKREEVERAAGKDFVRYLEVRYGDLCSLDVGLAMVKLLLDSGFTICGPDELPMPKDDRQAGGLLSYDEYVNRYQRERNGDKP